MIHRDLAKGIGAKVYLPSEIGSDYDDLKECRLLIFGARRLHAERMPRKRGLSDNVIDRSDKTARASPEPVQNLRPLRSNSLIQ
jgi:hypothetical protein